MILWDSVAKTTAKAVLWRYFPSSVTVLAGTRNWQNGAPSLVYIQVVHPGSDTSFI